MADNTKLLVHILEKVDKMEEHVSCIRVDQAEMKGDLKYHIKRTDLLEDDMKKQRQETAWLAAPVYLIRCVLRWLRVIK